MTALATENRVDTDTTTPASSGSLPSRCTQELIDLIKVLIGNESLSSFCNRAGVSKGNLSRVLQGKGSLPKQETLFKLHSTNPNSIVKLNDLFLAAGYPEITEGNVPPGILVSYRTANRGFSNPSRLSAQFIILDYLESKQIQKFKISYDVDQKYCTIDLPEQKWYVVSSLSENLEKSYSDFEKTSKEITLLHKQYQIELKDIFFITNSPSLFRIIKNFVIHPFNVLFTKDNRTVSDICVCD